MLSSEIHKIKYIPPQSYAEAIQEEYAVCRTDLAAFIEKTFKMVSPGVEYKHNWHIECIAEYLMALYQREIKKLIINIPPRALKSISCNVAWPAWLLGKDPSSRIMSASYAQSLSDKHSTDCRLLIESPWYKNCFPRTSLSDDNNQKRKYVTTARGHRIATSVGGTATGEGANYLILDDPHSVSDAQSKAIRESQVEWIDTSWSSRLDDKENGVMLLIMQRVHEGDATGHLSRNKDWEHLVLPAIFERKTMIQIGSFKHLAKEGELLHEARESKKTLDNLKAQMGSYAFAGQYMQRPAPAGGGIFKREWIKLWPSKKPLPHFEYIIQSIDTAFTAETQNDSSAFTAWGIFSLGEDKGYGALLCDAWNEHLEYPELRRKMMLEYKTRYGDGEGKSVNCVLIEDKGSGITLRQELQRTGIPVRSYNPGRADKVQRAHTVTHLLEAGLIFFPESDKFPNKTYSWAEEIIQQLLLFPNAEHDDYVDSFTQALQLLKDQTWLKVKGLPQPQPEERVARVNPYMM